MRYPNCGIRVLEQIVKNIQVQRNSERRHPKVLKIRLFSNVRNYQKKIYDGFDKSRCYMLHVCDLQLF